MEGSLMLTPGRSRAEPGGVRRGVSTAPREAACCWFLL
jgi:hypothetical protein